MSNFHELIHEGDRIQGVYREMLQGIRVELDHDFKQITIAGKSDSYRDALGMLLVMPPANTGDFGDDSINALYELILREANENISNCECGALPFDLYLKSFPGRICEGFNVQVTFDENGRRIIVSGLYDRRTARRVELIQDLYDLWIPESADEPVLDEYRKLLAEIGAVA